MRVPTAWPSAHTLVTRRDDGATSRGPEAREGVHGLLLWKFVDLIGWRGLRSLATAGHGCSSMAYPADGPMARHLRKLGHWEEEWSLQRSSQPLYDAEESSN